MRPTYAHPNPAPLLSSDALLDIEVENMNHLPPTHILVDIPDHAWQSMMADRWEQEQNSWR